MGNEVEIKSLSPSNLPAFGEVLHNQFVGHPDYKNLWIPKWDSSTYKTDVINAISDIYKKIGLSSYNDTPIGSYSLPVRIGDIIDIGSNSHIYIITAYTQQYIRTFPSYSTDDAYLFDPRSTSAMFSIRRPTLSSINFSKYEAVIREALPDELIKDQAKFGGTFKVNLPSEDSTHLQIGDLIFNVDPTQISFTTQNGFQYFPTIRTNGNPKLPTDQQIKNMNIVMIFPNEDAINYQLLPLYAMFRRTPFVNIRNRDITRFYQDIASSQGFIPVALESIQVQSIEGFPNSVQATVSLLPFEPGINNNGALKALKSFDDVYTQQKNREAGSQLEYMTKISDNKMQDEFPTNTPTSFEGLTSVVIDHTENFRESFPFRAFYQSLIAENKVVKNEYGNEEVLVGDKDSVKVSSDISFLAPINKDNALHHYNSEGNRTPISFSYKYLTFLEGKDAGNIRDVGKYLSEERVNRDDERLKWLTETMKTFQDWKSIPLAMLTAFPNVADALRPFDYQFGKMDQVINTVLMQHGLETVKITGPIRKDVGLTTILGFVFKSMLYNTGVPQAWNNAVNLKETANKMKSGEPVMNANDAWAILGKNPSYSDAHTGELSEYGIHTIEGAFKALWENIKDDATKREQFVAILGDIANAISGELKYTIEVRAQDDTTSDSPYFIKYLPISTKEIKIDNRFDVITSWSLTFANKFVPINLIAYKYPFYQHLGSEDATLSLAITSVPSVENSDLKSQLSEMSDRIYDSVKLINYTSPDLYIWMDPRVEITADAGNIFHSFGVRKVIMNSSNSSNIQGQPDSWNTVVNLTQANFSIEQYHSIESISTTSEIEAILANLLPRIALKNGSIIVRKFYSPNKTLTLDDLLMLSFLGSNAGGKWWNHLATTLKTLGISLNIKTESIDNASNDKRFIGEQLLQQVIPGIKEVLGIDFNEEDSAATSALQSACANNRKFDQLLRAIVKEYDTLLDRQGEAFETLISVHTSQLKLVGKQLSIMGSDAKFVVVGAGVVAIALLFIPGGQLLAGPLLWATWAGLMGSTIHGYVEAKKDQVLDNVRDNFGGLLQKMLNTYKKEMLLQLTHAVVKDPPIRKRLFAPAIVNLAIPPRTVGDQKVSFDVDQALKERESFGRINCYKDFDVPLTWTIDGRSVRSSPDFYLYNHTDPLYYAQSYIKDSTERMLKAGRRGVQMCLLEHNDLITRFDVLISGIGNSDANLNTILYGPDGIGGIAAELGYSNNLADSQINIAQLYRISSLQESEKIGDVERESKNLSLSMDKKNEYLVEFQKVNAELLKNNKSLYDAQFNAFVHFLDIGIAPKANIDSKKLNLVWTARMRCLLELVEMSTAIKTYYAQAGIGNAAIAIDKDSMEKIRKNTKIDSEMVLGSIAKEQLAKLNEAINSILKNWQTATTAELNKKGSTEPYVSIMNAQSSKGLSASPISADAKLSLPAIKVLENEVYNKIGYYIRLNSAIEEYNEVGGTVSLDALPELQMLDIWNLRATESTFRQLEIEKQYFDSLRRQNAPTLKFFPTFKIYFIEEDTGRSNLLDDFYAYNAVQTIEITKSKTSSSSVAVLRLSNLTGTMTDKLSFHREKSDFQAKQDPFASSDEAFFGTLDVKPGTKVQIKLGYAADERYLSTVFTGRILEMNVGPVTEIICQSHGAQLQHKIYTAKFGFFASEKEYGDIASSLLDMIPGLENLGKKDIITFGLLGGFTGRELGKLRKNLFDNFLLTNLLGRLTADMKSSNNPRDENIYLPFNLSLYAPAKPQFDWVVYNQSVWNALQELCLYTSNTDPVLKQFNNDPFSNRNEQRETLVIGNKSGYYKFTDSLSLSSLDTDKIERAIKQFDEAKGTLNNSSLKGLDEVNIKNILIQGFRILGGKWEPEFNISNSNNEKLLSNALKIFYTDSSISQGGIRSDGVFPDIKLKNEWSGLWRFLSDPLNITIIKKRLLQSIDISIRESWQFITQKMDKELKTGNLNNWHASRAIALLDNFSNSSVELDPVANSIDPNLALLFARIAFHMSCLSDKNAPNFTSNQHSLDSQMNTTATQQNSTGHKFWDLSADEFYGVSTEVNNTNPALSMDPRYKKIQQHYLVTDSTNLIENNISLNANFANMINLYYLDEPQFINGIDGVPPEKFDKLNVWTIKAFGDIKDEHVRPLDSFQKNVDPWWMDIAEKQGAFFKGFRRLNYNHMPETDSKGTPRAKQFNSYIETLGNGTFNVNAPDWRSFPSFQVVGVNLLKKQVAQMYRGVIQIVGDCSIEPMDIIHIEDYINDMHGVVEAEEVIHTFTPDRGLITTIIPSLVTYDRDPIQNEDVGIINRIYGIAEETKKRTYGKAFGGVASVLGGALSVRGGSPVIGSFLAGAGAIAAFSGFKSIIGQDYHKFLYEQMGNIIGRDCINFTALIYHGMPYMCGFDGVDYTSLKTLMVHKVEDIKNPISRISAFSDPFAASIYTNFNPSDFSASKAMINNQGKSAGLLQFIMGYPTHGKLNDAFTVWDRINPLNGRF